MPPQMPSKPYGPKLTTRQAILIAVSIWLGYLCMWPGMIYLGLSLMRWAKQDALAVQRSKTVTPITAPAQAAPRNVLPEYRWHLHSTKPFNEVRVPFAYKCGRVQASSNTAYIFIPATLAGKRCLCAIDTGASNECWPGWMRLPGRHETGATAKGINNSQRATDIVTLSHVQIGDYQLTDLRSHMLKRNIKEQGFTDVVPTFGNYSLYHTVLTIDYQNKMVVLRSPDYDLTRLPRSQQDMLLDFDWIGSCPTLHGTIEGRPAKLLVDTGFTGKFAVAKKYAVGILNRRKLSKHLATGAFGNMQGAFMDKARCTVGSVTMDERNVGVPDLSADWDGIVGQQFLALYEVTIDYPRRKILLRRNTLRDTRQFNGRLTLNVY